MKSKRKMQSPFAARCSDLAIVIRKLRKKESFHDRLAARLAKGPIELPAVA